MASSASASASAPAPAAGGARARAPPADPIAADPIAAALARARAEAAGSQRLWNLSDLAPFAPPPCRFPRLACRGSPASFAIAADDAEFCRRLRAAAPGLAGFDFEGSGLVLAGGAPLALLSGEAAVFDDLDLFFVGDGPAGGAEASLALLARYLYAAWEGSLEVYRTEKFVTFRDPVGLTRVQVVLFRYSGIAPLLYDFDLGGVAFDGRRVWLSEFGRLAAETGVLTPNWLSARESLSARIVKFCLRGFSVLLPELDPGSAFEHPTLRGRFSLAKHGLLLVEDLSSGGPAAAYQALPYGSPLELAVHNLCKPSRGCAFSLYSPGLRLTSFPASLDLASLSEAVGLGEPLGARVVSALAPDFGGRARVVQALRDARTSEAAGLDSDVLASFRAMAPVVPFAVGARGFGLGPFGRSPRAWYGPSFAEYMV